MRRTHLTAALLALAVGCATPEPAAPKQAWDSGGAGVVSPEEAVGDAQTPTTCELAARERLRTDPEGGWAMLKLCTRRWMYTDLRQLIAQPAWVEQLKTRPDAALYLGHVIALRGGDAENDIELLRAKGVEIYSLSGLTDRSGTHVNGYTLVRARVADTFRDKDQQLTLILAEISRSMAHGPRPEGAPAGSAATTLPAGDGSAGPEGAADPAALLQQLAALQKAMAASPSAPSAAPAAGDPKGVNLEYQDSGYVAVATLASGVKVPADGANLLFVAKIVGQVRAPGVDGQTVKGYEKEPMVPNLSVLRYYPVSGVAMY